MIDDQNQKLLDKYNPMTKLERWLVRLLARNGGEMSYAKILHYNAGDNLKRDIIPALRNLGATCTASIERGSIWRLPE